jgi:organic radical activating enzyme
MITQERKEEYLKQYKYPYIALNLHRFCSHGCWYCSDGHNNPLMNDKSCIIDTMGVNNYIEKILELAKVTTHFRINGGEPFEGKYIVEITKAILQKGHLISFLTNLTHVDIVYDICLPYKNRVRMEASFHIGAYLKRQQPEVFIDKFLNDYFVKATQISYKTDIVIVLTKDVLYYDKLYEALDKIKEIGKSNDCNVKLVFQEMYGNDTINGKLESFPRAYTEEDRQKIVELNHHYDNPNYQLSDINTITKVNRELKLKGQDCFYMNRILDIHYNGRITRCNSGFPPQSENLETTQLTLSNDFSPCVYDVCSCIYRGIIACLTPNGITLDDYMKMTDEEK